MPRRDLAPSSRLKPEVYGEGMDERMTSTTFEIPGYQVVENFGVVRGITVRSRSVFGTIGAAFQTLLGGNITLYTELCEMTRIEAFRILLQHASEVGANALIGVRYDATEIMTGVTEVLCYGTAVKVEPVEIASQRQLRPE
jgi:uncharacterized protein YbjQ (UPF0145 family)